MSAHPILRGAYAAQQQRAEAARQRQREEKAKLAAIKKSLEDYEEYLTEFVASANELLGLGLSLEHYGDDDQVIRVLAGDDAWVGIEGAPDRGLVDTQFQRHRDSTRSSRCRPHHGGELRFLE